ncbi:MAG: methyltransferase domain-containing protein [Thermoleophilaceae bacterium]|nr:methyltransferase domain-containing protein [Thermoleophilaceae bacterium]
MSAADTAAARQAVASNKLWYHTMEVAPGVVTPGWFDLRGIIAGLPWPDVEGKRCLDVGTYDGMLAFELERRGAAEVVATDIADHELWDWPPRLRAQGAEFLREAAGEEKGRGFQIAAELLGSRVERRFSSVYELSPEAVGEFDVVTCGSLLLHLRDPLRALAAIRSVCRGEFMSCEQVDLGLSLRHRRRAVLAFDGTNHLLQWAVPNAAAHRSMLEAAGFDVIAGGELYGEDFGPAHRAVRRSPRSLAVAAARRIFTGSTGVPHHALLSRPAI